MSLVMLYSLSGFVALQLPDSLAFLVRSYHYLLGTAKFFASLSYFCFVNLSIVPLLLMC